MSIKVSFPHADYTTLDGPYVPQQSFVQAFTYGDFGPEGDVGGIDPDKILLPEPIHKHHPFAQHLLAKWQVLKTWTGGRKLNDLKGKYRVTLQTANTAYPSWKSTVRPGGFGELSFDGSATYIDCGQILGFSAEPFSIHAWIKTTSNTGAFRAIAGRGYLASAIGYGLYVDTSNFPVFQVRNGATTSIATGATAVNDGYWHLLHGVRTGGVTKLYVDGVLVASDSTAVTISSDTSKFMIGARDSTGAGFFFPGSIDDVAVYQRSFNAAEAFNLYTELRDGSPTLLNRVKTHSTVLATAHNTYNQTGSGGVLISGSGTVKRLLIPSTSGGVLISGSATVTQIGNTYNITASGFVKISGVAGYFLQTPTPPSYPCFGTFANTGSGGVKVSGSAITSVSPVKGSGGVLISGSAVVSSSLTFDAFAEVYHLGGVYTHSTGEVIDSGPAKLNGTAGDGKNVNTCPSVQQGLYYNSSGFNSTQLINLPSDSLTTSTPLTVSFLAQPTGKYTDRVFFARGLTDTQNHKGWQLKIGHTSNNLLFASVQLQGSGSWNRYTATGTTTLTLGCWYHIAVVFNPSSNLTIYLMGNQEAQVTFTESSLVAANNGSLIGKWDLGTPFIGNLQELRISSNVKTQSWLQAETANAFSDSFYTVGLEQQPILP